MLVVAHIGYTVGGAWAAQRGVLRRPIDFRLVAFMSLLPDILDRALYVFAIPDAQGGRLIAHTLLFNLALIAMLAATRRGLWMYGLASLGHLLLDADGLAPSHVLWPFLGVDLANIGIVGGGGAAGSYSVQLADHIRHVLSSYSNASLRAMLLDAGGLLALAGFALGEGLYRPTTLRRFLATGMSGLGKRPSHVSPCYEGQTEERAGPRSVLTS
ncbi:MAG TPA: hypothetical protein VJ256_06495 [Dehalococcoidia bacterium]|nr:hypothetical protein [Dehalococcoidia bacterium]